LECLVFSKRAILKASEEIYKKIPAVKREKCFHISNSSISNFVEVKNKIQSLFFDHAGIIKSKTGLEYVLNEIENMKSHKKMKSKDIGDIKTSGLLNLSNSIVLSSVSRKESRGTHQRSDFTETSELYLGNFYYYKDEINFEEKKWKLKKII
jgi:aspartate oxidase